MSNDPTPPDQIAPELAKVRFAGVYHDAPFALSLALRDGVLFLVLEGALTQNLPDSFVLGVERAAALVPTAKLAADVSKATHIASVMIAYLVSVVKLAQNRGQKALPLLQPSQRIVTLVKMVGLLELFTLAPTEADLRRQLGLK